MFEDISREEIRDAAPIRAISVSSRDGGGIVIRQRQPMGDEDACILVPPGQAENLIAAIRRELKPE